MTSAITDQFIDTGRILTSHAHAEKIIKELRDHTRHPIAVTHYKNGQTVIRKTLALTLDLEAS